MCKRLLCALSAPQWAARVLLNRRGCARGRSAGPAGPAGPARARQRARGWRPQYVITSCWSARPACSDPTCGTSTASRSPAWSKGTSKPSTVQACGARGWQGRGGSGGQGALRGVLHAACRAADEGESLSALSCPGSNPPAASCCCTPAGGRAPARSGPPTAAPAARRPRAADTPLRAAGGPGVLCVKSRRET